MSALPPAVAAAAPADAALGALVARLEASSGGAELAPLHRELAALGPRYPGPSCGAPELFGRLGRQLAKLPERHQQELVAALAPLREDVRRRMVAATEGLHVWLGGQATEEYVSPQELLAERLRALDLAPHVRFYRRCGDAETRARFLVAVASAIQAATDSSLERCYVGRHPPALALVQRLTQSFFVVPRHGNVLAAWLSARLDRYNAAWCRAAERAARSCREALRSRLCAAARQAAAVDSWLELRRWPMGGCPLARELAAVLAERAQDLGELGRPRLGECPAHSLRPETLLRALRLLGEAFQVSESRGPCGAVRLCAGGAEAAAAPGGRGGEAAQARHPWAAHAAAPPPPEAAEQALGAAPAAAPAAQKPAGAAAVATAAVPAAVAAAADAVAMPPPPPPPAPPPPPGKKPGARPSPVALGFEAPAGPRGAAPPQAQAPAEAQASKAAGPLRIDWQDIPFLERLIRAGLPVDAAWQAAWNEHCFLRKYPADFSSPLPSDLIREFVEQHLYELRNKEWARAVPPEAPAASARAAADSAPGGQVARQAAPGAGAQQAAAPAPAAGAAAAAAAAAAAVNQRLASGGGERKQARGGSGSARGSSRSASSSSSRRRQRRKKEKGKKKGKKDEKAKRAPGGESSLGESSDGLEPLGTVPDFYHKSKMCWTFLEGRCTLDKYCTAAHSQSELVQPGEARKLWQERVDRRQRRAEKKRRLAEAEAASDPSGGMGNPFFGWSPYPPELMHQWGMPPGGHMAMPWGMPPGMPYPGSPQPAMVQSAGAGAPGAEKKSRREEKAKKKKDKDEKKEKEKEKDKDKDKDKAKDKKQKKDKEGKDAGEGKAKKQREATIGPRPG